ncbi:helix-turn-helix transcriptional regulator [Serratia liquefaciens]|uniref:helix-turn-helix transcriptional regulator n=1 Tax=Serratia liquefaciens TaxID=614 RepID=UPI002361FED8|nr:LuxR C-terminal-related transcriptional regulator [Serratia liquefaciens]
MRSCFTVVFQDSNRFFALGMEHILRAHLATRGYDAKFIFGDHNDAVDMVVRAEAKAWQRSPCRLLGQEWRNDRSLITVRGTADSHRQTGLACRGELGVLDRRDNPASVIYLVDKLLAPAATYMRSEPARCERCSYRLTEREQQVLFAISLEMQPSQVAKYLQLSPKTVSSHKRTAMRKLGFQRDIDLYHWLRTGGLMQKRMEQ